VENNVRDTPSVEPVYELSFPNRALLVESFFLLIPEACIENVSLFLIKLPLTSSKYVLTDIFDYMFAQV
jgi:hypothetical protein